MSKILKNIFYFGQMTPLIKICGLTNARDALLSARLGADFLGFIFYPPSPRQIDLPIATKVARAIRKKFPRVKLVGVFVDEPLVKIQTATRLVGLDVIQLHGRETPRYCQALSAILKIPIWKAIRVKSAQDISRAKKFYDTAEGILFDTYVKNQPGGTGQTFNWQILGAVRRPRTLILSGGLNAENIVGAIVKIQPSIIDLSSGVEESPGRKDSQKLRALFAKVNLKK
jgi:phosphoribosylanthranilate isomerase